jgi:drug/metabolite transporter (DMT)-like permease
MRMSTITGVVLIIAGAFLFVRGGSFTSRRDVVRVGGVTVAAEEQRPIRPWMAGIAVIAGVAVIAVGMRQQRAQGT